MERKDNEMNKKDSTKCNSTGEVDHKKFVFDKKKYRQQKYSNKYKVAVWNNKRREASMKKLYHSVCNKKGIFIKAKSPEDYINSSQKEIPNRIPNSILAARLAQKRRQNELRQKKEEALKAKSERHEALKKYRERKNEKFKKLSRKTKKGQPVMKDRLELLLAKIQLENK